jgi:hypothetical protein
MTSGCQTRSIRNAQTVDGEWYPQWAVQWLSQQMPRFNPEPVHVTLVMDKVAMGQGFLQVLRSSPVSITSQIVHTHPFITDAI